MPTNCLVSVSLAGARVVKALAYGRASVEPPWAMGGTVSGRGRGGGGARGMPFACPKFDRHEAKVPTDEQAGLGLSGELHVQCVGGHACTWAGGKGQHGSRAGLGRVLTPDDAAGSRRRFDDG